MTDADVKKLTEKFREELHARNLLDSVYVEGYESESSENPYPFPLSLSNSMSEIASKPERLTDKEKYALKSFREQLEKTEWDRWSNGYYTKSLQDED
jgi:hypothetical protein